jgi:Domain of unknown function (DUF1956).
LINNPEELKNNIIKSASLFFYKHEFHSVKMEDICIASGSSIAEIESLFLDMKGLYAEILNIGQKNYFNHPIFNEVNDSFSSVKSKIDSFVEHEICHIQEKDNWCTKVFAKELLLPSNRLTPLVNEVITQKMHTALAALGVYTNLNPDDPLLIMTFTQCFAPGLRLIALTHSDYPLLKPLLSLPQHELYGYLKTFIFSGLEGIRYINLSLEIT